MRRRNPPPVGEMLAKRSAPRLTDVDRLLEALPGNDAVSTRDLQLRAALPDDRFRVALERAFRLEYIATDDRASTWRRDRSALAGPIR